MKFGPLLPRINVPAPFRVDGSIDTQERVVPGGSQRDGAVVGDGPHQRRRRVVRDLQVAVD